MTAKTDKLGRYCIPHLVNSNIVHVHEMHVLTGKPPSCMPSVKNNGYNPMRQAANTTGRQ